MESISRDIDFLRGICKECHQLCHASNIKKKVDNKKRSAKETAALVLLVPEYVSYLKNILEVVNYNKEAVFKKVDCLNEYYNFLHDNQLENIFTSQSKFRSTILEEFLYLMFRDYIQHVKSSEDKENVIDSGAVKAYSNIYFKAKNFADFIKSPKINVNEKDQDYAIYRNFDISIGGAKPVHIRIPAIAIGVKTYIDKTMLDSIIATAEKIKNGNPYARFVAVAEYYDVGFNVDPAYSRIDQIYILRKTYRRNPEWKEIDREVVWRMFEEIREHLESPWSDVESKMRKNGVII